MFSNTVNIRLVDISVSQHFAELTQIAWSFEISNLLDSPVSRHLVIQHEKLDYLSNRKLSLFL